MTLLFLPADEFVLGSVLVAVVKIAEVDTLVLSVVVIFMPITEDVIVAVETVLSGIVIVSDVVVGAAVVEVVLVKLALIVIVCVDEIIVERVDDGVVVRVVAVVVGV